MRLQASTEFLVTYGWAFVVIAILLLVLIGAGIFNPFSYTAQTCAISSSFTCVSYSMTIFGRLVLNLRQTLSSPINVTSYACGTAGTKPHFESLGIAPYQYYMPVGASVTIKVQCFTPFGPANGTQPFSFSGYIIINYTNDITNIPSTASGTVIVKAT